MFLGAQLELFINRQEGVEVKLGAPGLLLRNESKIELFEEPTRFLLERYVNSSATPSHHTWHAAAYALKSWFQYLQAMELDWSVVGELDRRDFRDAFLASISPRTGRPYGLVGVRNALTVVREFYLFCAERKLYDGDIGTHEYSVKVDRTLDRDALVHLHVGKRLMVKDRALPKIRTAQKTHPLMVRDLKSLLHQVGPQAGISSSDKRRSRDRVICDLGWAAGLRLDEITSLTTLQFLGIVPDDAAPFANVALTIYFGKGGKTRRVAIPNWLARDVVAYIETERELSLRRGKKMGRKLPTQLLLAHPNSKSAGQPISNSAVQKMFREACFAAGLVEQVKKVNPIDGTTFTQKVPRHSFHDLRHTYAVLTYHAERANGNSEPWKKIQAQLGHRHLQTTVDTYLSYVEIFDHQPGLMNVRRMLGI